jgi:selenocysteine-specific elongation factor
VTQLDAKSLERGIACTPGYISSVSCALVAVRHIRFFKSACKTGSKFHVTVGHTTVMGTATFFAAAAIAPREATVEGTADEAARKAAAAARALQLARLPLPNAFDETAEYLYQDELDTDSPEQWAVLQLEQPVACALPATAICSHLETDCNLNTCRIAFYGRLLQAVAPENVHALRIFKWKRKEGQVRHPCGRRYAHPPCQDRRVRMWASSFRRFPHAVPARQSSSLPRPISPLRLCRWNACRMTIRSSARTSSDREQT